jgi:hypothetical protein
MDRYGHQQQFGPDPEQTQQISPAPTPPPVWPPTAYGHTATPPAPVNWVPPAIPAAPQKRHRWPWIVGGCILAALVLCGIGVAGLVGSAAKDVDDQIQHGSADKAAAVKITGCHQNSLGMEISYEVTNSTGRAQSYWAVFEVVDAAGTRLAEAHGIVNDLAPGSTAKDTAVAVVDDGVSRCRLVRVD